MEGNMVSKSNWWDSTIGVVKKYFQKELPQFILKKELSHGPFWNVEFCRDNLAIEIGGDIGFHIYMYIYNSKYDLWQYDRSVNEKMKTTEENILYQLEILKRFLNEL